MTGKPSTHGDHALPNVDDEDDGNEATIAMETSAVGAKTPLGAPRPVLSPPRASGASPAMGAGGAGGPASRLGAGAGAGAGAGPQIRPKPFAPKATHMGLGPPGGATSPLRGAGAAPPSPRVPAAPPEVPKLAQTGGDDDEMTMATDMTGGRVPGRPSPLASTAGPGPGEPQRAPLFGATAPLTQDAAAAQKDVATVSVPQDVLDRVRRDPKAVLAEEAARKAPGAAPVPKIEHAEDEGYDETKAVERDELLRRQEEEVRVRVVGEGGEESTISVGSGRHPMVGAAGAPGQPGGYPGQGPHPHMGQATLPIGAMGPGMGMGPGMPGPGMGMGPGPGMGHNPWGAPHPGHPMMHPQMGQMGQMGMHPGQAPPGWAQPQQPASRSKMNRQLILLFVVGFICLAIFITGIVLFATTRF